MTNQDSNSRVGLIHSGCLCVMGLAGRSGADGHVAAEADDETRTTLVFLVGMEGD